MTGTTGDADPTADTEAGTEEQRSPSVSGLLAFASDVAPGLGAAYERVVAFCAPVERPAGLHV